MRDRSKHDICIIFGAFMSDQSVREDHTVKLFQAALMDLKMYVREILESREDLNDNQEYNIKKQLAEISRWMLSLKRLLTYQDYVDSLRQYPKIHVLFKPYQEMLDNAIRKCSPGCRYMLVMERFRLLLNYVHTEEDVKRETVRNDLTIVTSRLIGYRQLLEFLRLALDSFQLGIDNHLKKPNLVILSDIVKCFLTRIRKIIRQENSIGELLMVNSFVPCQFAPYERYMKSLLSDVQMRMAAIREKAEEDEIKKYEEEKQLREMAAKIDEAFCHQYEAFDDPDEVFRDAQDIF